MFNQTRRLTWGILWLALLSAACGPAATLTSTPSATPIPTATIPPATPTTAAGPPTLPATWTPTHTHTPVAPTVTATATHTPTITPTADAAARCAAFQWVGNPREGARLNFHENVNATFTWQYTLADGGVRLTVWRAGADVAREVVMPGPEVVIFTMPLTTLFGPGGYRWQAAPLDADGEPVEDCALTGRFSLLIRPRAANRYPQPLALPWEPPPDLVPPPLIPRWWL